MCRYDNKQGNRANLGVQYTFDDLVETWSALKKMRINSGYTGGRGFYTHEIVSALTNLLSSLKESGINLILQFFFIGVSLVLVIYLYT